MPHKANAARRHHIPRPKRKVTSWAEYDASLRLCGSLKGFPEAIAAAYPETIVQTCIVRLLRHSMEFASWKDRRAIAALKTVYDAVDDKAAEVALSAFEGGPWGENMRPSARRGGGRGRRSSRSLPSPARSGASFTPRVP
ncbi:Transposase [Azospirillum melinis]